MNIINVYISRTIPFGEFLFSFNLSNNSFTCSILNLFYSLKAPFL